MVSSEVDPSDILETSQADYLPTGWELVCGLEVHTELKTVTKLFCGCRNEFGSEPNTNVCPVCLGLPGALPVLNGAALELAAKIGLALGARVQWSIFHRKNYFYPDMPKDFQISQYDIPLNADGYLDLPSGVRIGIVRAHMEEDTGKITHLGGASGRIHGAERALIDYNRSGVPLVEIVSAPDIKSPEEARQYVSELRTILVSIGASDGKMEEGSLRVDANVSVRPIGEVGFRTRCEIKNLNSLRSLVRAITYEAQRQVEVYQSNGVVKQQTRHWDEDRALTVELRTKEEAEDYRYFPEPDLVPLEPSAEWVQLVRSSLGELPRQRRLRLCELLELSEPNDQVETAISNELYPYVNSALSKGLDPRLVVARASNELAGLAPIPGEFLSEWFSELCEMELSKELSATQAKSVLQESVRRLIPPGEARDILGIKPISDQDLMDQVRSIVDTSPTEWVRYKAGEQQLKGFFIGQIMKKTSGMADGKTAAEMLQRLVAEDL